MFALCAVVHAISCHTAPLTLSEAIGAITNFAFAVDGTAMLGLSLMGMYVANIYSCPTRCGLCYEIFCHTCRSAKYNIGILTPAMKGHSGSSLKNLSIMLKASSGFPCPTMWPAPFTVAKERPS